MIVAPSNAIVIGPFGEELDGLLVLGSTDEIDSTAILLLIE
jgi:hypothetical protein